jgi:hypothetical protein
MSTQHNMVRKCSCDNIIGTIEFESEIAYADRDEIRVSHTANCPKHGVLEIDFTSYMCKDSTVKFYMIHLNGALVRWYSI